MFPDRLLPQPPVVADMGLWGNRAVPVINQSSHAICSPSRRASFCGSSPALQQGSSHTGLGLRGFRLRLSSYIFWREFLGGFRVVSPPPCKLGGCGGVGFRLGFQFLVGVLLPAPAGFKAFRFLRREGLSRVLRGGKLFERPGLGRLRCFLPFIPCLMLAVFPLSVSGKAFCFLRREVGSGLLQRGKLL